MAASHLSSRLLYVVVVIAVLFSPLSNLIPTPVMDAQSTPIASEAPNVDLLPSEQEDASFGTTQSQSVVFPEALPDLSPGVFGKPVNPLPSAQTSTFQTVFPDMPAPPYVNLHVTLESEADKQSLAPVQQSIESHGWIATFYMTPEFAARYPQVVKDLLDRKHELGVLIGDDLKALSDDEQMLRIDQALEAVRQAAGVGRDYPLHVRFQQYVVKYEQIQNTLRALNTLGVPTLAGVFGVGDDFFCHYCADNGRLMYPLLAKDAGKVVMLPVAVSSGESSASITEPAPRSEAKAQWPEGVLPLDDAVFRSLGNAAQLQTQTSITKDLFTVALAQYNAFAGPGQEQTETEGEKPTNYVHDKFMTIIVHPSITGADDTALASLRSFLDQVDQKGGSLTSNAQLVNLTVQVLASGYIGSLSITADTTAAPPQSSVNLTINYQSTLYCPTFYFRIYGKYPSQSDWQQLHDQSSYYVTTGQHSFSKVATVPDPPTQNDTTYTFLVVGQSCAGGRCNWPTPTSYERKAEVSVNVPHSELEIGGGRDYKGRYKNLVFRRGSDTPQFTVKVRGQMPVDGQIVVDIFRWGEQTPLSRAPLVRSSGDFKGVWDWSSTLWRTSEIPDMIPVGAYEAEAKCIISGREGCKSERKPFYVIFDAPQGVSPRYANDEYSSNYHSYNSNLTQWNEAARNLQPFNEHLFEIALAAVEGQTSADAAATRLLKAVSNVIHYCCVSDKPVDDMFRDTVSKEQFVAAANGTENALLRGQCLDYAASLAAVLRSVGILSRTATGIAKPEGGFSYHEWTEAYLTDWKVADAMDYWHRCSFEVLDVCLGYEYYDDSAAPTTSAPESRSTFQYGDVSAEVAVGDPGWAVDGGWLAMNRETGQVVRGNAEANDVLLEKCEGRNYDTSGCNTGLVESISQPAVLSTDDVALTMHLDSETARVGDAVTATMLITNLGSSPVNLSGVFAFQHQDVRADRPQWKVLYGEVLTVTLPASGSTSLQRSIVITDVFYPYDTFRAFAGVTGPVTRTVEAGFDVMPAFNISTGHPDSVRWNESFTVTVAITNQVAFALENVQLSLELPAAFATVPVTVTLGRLDGRTSQTYSWLIHPTTEEPSSNEEIRVNVSTTNGGRAQSKLIQVVQRPPALIVRAEPASFDVAWQSTTTISFTVRNGGDQPLSGVTVILTAPVGITPTISSWNVGSLYGGQELALITSLQTGLATDFFVELAASDLTGNSDSSAIHFHVLGAPLPPHKIALTGSYSDQAIDTNGDGLFNVLRMNIGINVTNSGSYLAKGYLWDAQANLITSASAFMSVTQGPQTIMIDFDGMAIRNYGVNGPYVLGLIEVYDHQSGLEDYARQSHTTTAYAYTVFEAGGVVSGTVRNQAGQVISDVLVSLIGPRTASGLTNIYGQYTFTRLAAGYYTLYALPPANAYLGEGQGGTLLSSGGTSLVDFALQPAGVIAGHVTDESGNPIQAEIDLGGFEPPHYATDKDGAYRISSLTPGNYSVHLSSSYSDWWIWVDGSHIDNGSQAGITVVASRTTEVDFRRPPITPTADLAVDKSLYSGVIGLDEEAQYRIRVRNLGNLTVTHAIITDTLPPVASYVAESHPTGFAVITGSQIIWTKDALPAYGQSGAEAELYLTARMTSTLASGVQVTNTLTSSNAAGEADYRNNVYAYAQTAISPTRDLQISKSFYSGRLFSGSDVQYRILYQLSGNSAAPNVLITDTLPLSMSYVSDSNTSGFTAVINGRVVVWRKAHVLPGESGYLYLTGHISDTVAPGTWLTNTVQIANGRLETDYANNTYTDVEIVQAPARDMAVSALLNSGTAVAGNDVQYQLYVGNHGNADAANIIVTNTLPVSTTYVTDTNWDGFTTIITGNTVVWTKPTMSPGSYAYLYLTAHIADNVQGGAVLTNTTRVSTSDVEAKPADNVYTYTVMAQTPTRDLYLSKGLDSGSPTPGNELRYWIYYSNQGNSPADQVVITDTLPVSMTYLSFSGAYTPTVTGNQVIWTLGRVPGSGYAGSGGYLYATSRLSDQVSIGTVLTNTATIRTAHAESDYTDNTSQDVRSVYAGTSDLYLSKSLQGSYAAQGSEVTYQLYYSNYANDAATHAVLTDTLPVGMSYVNSTGASAPAVAGNAVVWTIGTVPGNTNSRIYVTAYISDSVAVGTVLTNTAVISASNDPYPSGNNENDVQTVVAATRDLSVYKSLSSGAPVIGSDMTYSIHYRNYGTASVRNVALTDTLPAGVSFVSASGSFTPALAGNLLVWNMGTVPSQYTTGSEGYFYVTVRVADTLAAGTSLCNRVDISTSDVETGQYQNSASDCRTVQAPTRDVGISKELSTGTPLAGNIVTYRLYYYNRGNSPAANVVITDTLPPGMIYDPAYGNSDYSGWTRVVSGRRVTWTRPTLAAGVGGSVYVSGLISTSVLPKTVLTNTAQIATADVEIDYTNNVSAYGLSVLSSGRDLSIAKSWQDGVRAAGQVLTYRLSYRNAGAQSASNVVIADTLPPELTYSWWASSNYNWSMIRTGNAITWTRSSVYGSESGYLDLGVIITDTIADGTVVTNSVQIGSSDADDDPGDNQAVLPLTVATASRDLYVDKWPSSGSLAPGQDIVYTLLYQNYGTAAAANVVVTDDLPAGLAFVSSSGGVMPTLIGNKVIWNLGTVPGQYASGYYGYLHVTAHVSETATIGSSLCNQAAIATSDLETGLSANTTSTCSTIQAPVRDMYVTKWLDDGDATPGNNLHYGIHFYNEGNSMASDVIITDTLPLSTSVVSWSGYAYNPNYVDLARTITSTIIGNQIVWNLGSVAAYGYGYIYPVVRLSPAAPIGAPVDNIAKISTAQAESDYTDNLAVDNRVVFTNTADVAIGKMLLGNTLANGSEATYLINYFNNSLSAASHVSITDELPTGLSYISAAGVVSPTLVGDTLIWDLDAVPGYTSNVLTLTVAVSDGVAIGSMLTNTVVIDAANDNSSHNNVASDVHAVAAATRDLYVYKWISAGTGEVGREITYTLAYGNYENASASAVVITDTLPVSMTFVSASGPVTPTIMGQQVVWALGTVPALYVPGYAGMLYLTARINENVPSETLLTNEVVISTPQIETVYYNNSSSVTFVALGPRYKIFLPLLTREH